MPRFHFLGLRPLSVFLKNSLSLKGLFYCNQKTLMVVFLLGPTLKVDSTVIKILGPCLKVDGTVIKMLGPCLKVGGTVIKKSWWVFKMLWASIKILKIHSSRNLDERPVSHQDIENSHQDILMTVHQENPRKWILGTIKIPPFATYFFFWCFLKNLKNTKKDFWFFWRHREVN